MSKVLRKTKTVLVPIGIGTVGQSALTIAQAIAEEVVLVGVVPIASGESVSAGAQGARAVRKRLLSLGNATTRFKSTVIVSELPWKDIQEVISFEKPDLLIVEWKDGLITCGVPVSDILSNTLCDVVILRGASPLKFERTLIAVRGGSYAELALQAGMSLHPACLDVLHLALTGKENDTPFKGMKHILRQIPEVNLRSVTTSDTAQAILEESGQYDMVVLGVTASKSMGGPSIGPVAEKMLREARATVMVVKTRRPISENMLDESAGALAISILVDKWFAENTFHANEFADLKQLMALKEKQGVTISLALPALNEEKTVGKIIAMIKKALMVETPLLDEMVLIDSNSIDQTRQIAESLGVPVYIHQKLLPELGAREGKGEALWKSLMVTKGDIIAWIDTDIINIHPRFVYGVIGPLLLNPEIQLVKGFYRRPLKLGGKTLAGGGGRVTELTARPLLNLFYPELSGIVQPLSGEYAGRRGALEKAIFFSGYGVETGLLIDVFEQFGLRSIAQVDLLERIHKNQDLVALSKMSFAIIQTVLRKIETRYERAIVEDVNKTMKLIRHSRDGYYLTVEDIAERERPPMINVPAYMERGKE
ncbi:MAG: glucosyl-3-phosphoglycerate synthase [Anaerolineales bacterium]|jgi:glucosyl-3-phosphoglycerate synthase